MHTFLLLLWSALPAFGQSIEASHPQFGNPARLTSVPVANPATAVVLGQNAISAQQSWFDLRGLQNEWTVIGDFNGDAVYRNDDGLYEVGQVNGMSRMARSTFSIVISPRDYLKFVKSDKWRRWLDNRVAMHLALDLGSGPEVPITPGWVPKYAMLDGSYFPTIEGGLSFVVGPRVLFLGVGVHLGEIGVNARADAVGSGDLVAFPADDEDATVDVTAAGELRSLALGIAPKVGVHLGAILDLGPLIDPGQAVPRYGLRLGYTYRSQTRVKIGGTLTGSVSARGEIDGEVVVDDTLVAGELFTLDPQIGILSPASMNFGLEAYAGNVAFGGWGRWVQWSTFPAPTGIAFAASGTSDALDYELRLGEDYGESGFTDAWAAGAHLRYTHDFTRFKGRFTELKVAPELGFTWVDDFIPDQINTSNLLNGRRYAANLCTMLAINGLVDTHSGLQFDACVQGNFMQRKSVTKTGGTRVDDDGVSVLPPGTPFPDKTLESGGQFWVFTLGMRWTFGRPASVAREG